MYVHHAAKLIFLAHPRTASNSTAQALMTVGFEGDGSHHLYQSYRHVEGYASFCTVRNHWDAVASWLCHTHELTESAVNPHTWSVADIEKALDNSWIDSDRMWFHMERCANVLRFEDLSSDLGNLLTLAGLPNPELPHLGFNATRDSRPASAFFKASTREYVATRFADEIRELGYEAPEHFVREIA